MGYCEGDCPKLNSKAHKCEKYGKKLAYMKQSGRGMIGFLVHEQCEQCRTDEYMYYLENEIKSCEKEHDQWHREALTYADQLGMLRIWLKSRMGITLEYVLEDCKTMFPNTTDAKTHNS